MASGPANNGEGKRSGWIRLLLLLPFVAMLWVPFYNSVQPSWLEIPFFYWYQMLWIVLCAVIVGIVYVAEK
jgi:hypothetical protein